MSSRKCSKCEATVDNKTVKYYRFPKPEKDTILRAKAWAIFCWPEKDWSSVDSLLQLHKCHKVLCGRHFAKSCFLSGKRMQISRYSVPGPEQYVRDLIHTLREQDKFEQGSRHDFEDQNVDTEEPELILPDKINYPAVMNGVQRSSTNHEWYQCNICSGDISGFRYMCVQCADFYLCAPCKSRGAHAAHYVLRVPGPRPPSEIQSVLTTIRRQLQYDSVRKLQTTFADEIPHEVKQEQEVPISKEIAPEDDHAASINTHDIKYHDYSDNSEDTTVEVGLHRNRSSSYTSSPRRKRKRVKSEDTQSDEDARISDVPFPVIFQ